MVRPVLYISLAMAALMTGCDHGVNVSSETVATQGYKGENSVGSTESQSVSKSTKRTEKFQLLQLITRAADSYTQFIGRDGNPNSGARPAWLGSAWKLKTLADSGDAEAKRSLQAHSEAIYTLRAALQPSNGWPMRENEVKYMHRKTMELTFADQLADTLARGMDGSYSNQDEIDKRFVDVLFEVPIAQIDAMMAYSVATANRDQAGRITVDGVSGHGTTWTAGVNSYDGQANGWIVRRGGAIELGEGHIAGVTREVEVAAAGSLDSRVESAHRLGDHAGADDVSKGTASVK